MKSRTYRAWAKMKERCNNPNNVSYPYYGGRGIHYTSNWEGFEQFLEDMGEAPDGFELDRLNNDDYYSKENCHWATRAQQVRNSSKAVLNQRQVKLIRAIRQATLPTTSNRRLAAILKGLFPVSRSAIEHILYGRTWKDV